MIQNFHYFRQSKISAPQPGMIGIALGLGLSLMLGATQGLSVTIDAADGAAALGPGLLATPADSELGELIATISQPYNDDTRAAISAALVRLELMGLEAKPAADALAKLSNLRQPPVKTKLPPSNQMQNSLAPSSLPLEGEYAAVVLAGLGDERALPALKVMVNSTSRSTAARGLARLGGKGTELAWMLVQNARDPGDDTGLIDLVANQPVTRRELPTVKELCQSRSFLVQKAAEQLFSNGRCREAVDVVWKQFATAKDFSARFQCILYLTNMARILPCEFERQEHLDPAFEAALVDAVISMVAAAPDNEKDRLADCCIKMVFASREWWRLRPSPNSDLMAPKQHALYLRELAQKRLSAIQSDRLHSLPFVLSSASRGKILRMAMKYVVNCSPGDDIYHAYCVCASNLVAYFEPDAQLGLPADYWISAQDREALAREFLSKPPLPDIYESMVLGLMTQLSADGQFVEPLSPATMDSLFDRMIQRAQPLPPYNPNQPAKESLRPLADRIFLRLFRRMLGDITKPTEHTPDEINKQLPPYERTFTGKTYTAWYATNRMKGPVEVYLPRLQVPDQKYMQVQELQTKLAKFTGKAGTVAFIGDGNTCAAAFAGWALTGKGKAAGDTELLAWMHCGAKDNTDGWYLATHTVANGRSATAAEGLDSRQLLDGGCHDLPKLADLIHTYNPQIAVVFLGAADIEHGLTPEQFLGNLKEIVGRLQDNGTLVVLTTLPPQAKKKIEGESINERIQWVAQENHLPLIDLYAVIDKYFPNNSWAGTVQGEGIGQLTAGDPTGFPVQANFKQSGLQLRAWLTIQKLREVKEKILNVKSAP